MLCHSAAYHCTLPTARLQGTTKHYFPTPTLPPTLPVSYIQLRISPYAAYNVTTPVATSPEVHINTISDKFSVTTIELRSVNVAVSVAPPQRPGRFNIGPRTEQARI
jgi:hypothetical protein